MGRQQVAVVSLVPSGRHGASNAPVLSLSGVAACSRGGNGTLREAVKVTVVAALAVGQQQLAREAMVPSDRHRTGESGKWLDVKRCVGGRGGGGW